MRPSIALPSLLLASLFLASAPAPALALGNAPAPVPLAGGPTKPPALKVEIDRAKVDLAGHTLEVKLSRAAAKVRLKVIGESGAVLAEVEKPFEGAAAGTTLVMSWTPSGPEAVAKIEVWGYDTEGYYAGVAIIPWSVNVPHEELNFESGSDVVRPGEVPKLEASLAKINEVVKKQAALGKITLFVVGHTDTVGSAQSNLELSRRRARSIGGWFKAHGLAIAIAYEGLGESSPLVKTADEVDEPKNRRADYILALEPPRGKNGDIAWKGL
jgi:outer membrane protein OmpA-like peptidoglycan-associated protein